MAASAEKVAQGWLPLVVIGFPTVTRADILPESAAASVYDADCRRCDRLAAFLDRVHAANPSYFCRPVPPFGAAAAALVIVGLAPGMHGANASGRPFTGDHAGILLYATLHAYCFASQPIATARGDGLALREVLKYPSVESVTLVDLDPEMTRLFGSNELLRQLNQDSQGGAILALGRIAHDATLSALGIKRSALAFAHGARHELPRDIALFDSYHCSRYNTNTRRLTEAMFDAVFAASFGPKQA